LKDQNWKGKISNVKQLGGIETSVIDNGSGRGSRIAWINTGTGLRYKVVIDRAMDIADAFYNQHSVAWLSGLGVSAPQPFSDKGLSWLRTFGGGLLVTCGLTHIGAPESDEFGERGLHGSISNIPAEIESIIQPDPLSGEMEMSITGSVKQAQIFGPSLELKRTISGTLGKPVIRIHDEITNRGNTPVPHMILYHCNFGWPLVDEGTDIIWNGKWKYSRGDGKEEIFKESNNFRKCPAPTKSHNGSGEEVAFIDIKHDGNNFCFCGLYNASLGIAMSMKFKKDQLPWLTNWQHWGNGEYVTGLEPGTNPCWGQAKSRQEGTLIQLEPGEKKSYDLEIEVLNDKKQIEEFIKKAS
jgi:hypothetical protein